MAEAWLNKLCGDYFEAQSAGLGPGTLNPLAVRVMAEVGIDISKKKTQAVFDVFTSGQLFAYVVTVCDETSAEKCPIFAGPATRLHWSFRDPSQVKGDETAKLQQVRLIRDQIREKIEVWCEKVCERAATSAA
jgi:arsenate reductase